MVALAKGATSKVSSALKDLDARRAALAEAKKAVEAAKLIKDAAIEAGNEANALQGHLAMEIVENQAEQGESRPC